MALDVAVGSFDIGAGAPGTTVSVTSLSFQPKVVIFQWSGLTSQQQVQLRHSQSLGYMVSASDRGGIATTSSHSAATATSAHIGYSNRAIIKVIKSGGVPLVQSAADFDAFLVNGFRLFINQAFSGGMLVNYIAIGGSDLTNVASTTVTAPATAIADGETQDVSVGFRPDCLISFGPQEAAINTPLLGKKLQLGVAAGNQIDGPTNAVLWGDSQDNVADTITGCYSRRGDFLVNLSSADPTTNTRGQAVRLLDDGFRIRWNEHTVPGVSLNWRVLCLKGARFSVGFAETSTETDSERFVEDAPFEPKALILGSHGKPESLVVGPTQAVDADDKESIGFASATDQNLVAILDRTGLATSQVGIDHRLDSVYASQVGFPSPLDPIVEDGRASLFSFDDDPGFTLTQDDGDAARSFFWYLAMTDAVSVGTAGTFAVPDTVPHSLLQQFATVPSPSDTPDTVPHSLLTPFNSAAQPWTPIYWGGPTSMLFSITAVSASLATVWEAMRSLTKDDTPPWEALLSRAATLVSPWEAVLSLAKSVSPPWEAMLSRAATFTLPWEALLSLASPLISPWEAQQGLTRDNTAPWESTQGLAAVSTPLWEALLSLAGISTTPWEALRLLAASLDVPFESLLALAASLVSPWEAGGATDASVITPWEAESSTIVPPTPPFNGQVNRAPGANLVRPHRRRDWLDECEPESTKLSEEQQIALLEIGVI